MSRTLRDADSSAVRKKFLYLCRVKAVKMQIEKYEIAIRKLFNTRRS